MKKFDPIRQVMLIVGNTLIPFKGKLEKDRGIRYVFLIINNFFFQIIFLQDTNIFTFRDISMYYYDINRLIVFTAIK